MPISMRVIKQLETVEPQLRGVLISIVDELEQTVTRTDFNELKEIVRDLASAQKGTEREVGALKVAVGELVNSQKETNERLAEFSKKTDERFAELATQQKEIRRELADTQRTVKESLAESSRRTDERFAELAAEQMKTRGILNELAEAHKETRRIMNELAEAQRKTEKALQELTKDHSKTREQLGGLSHTVGYMLENEAYKHLPALLKREFDLDVKGRLLRNFVKDNQGRQIEVNILGEATRKRARFMIVGESKSQLSKNKITEFTAKKLKRLEGVFKGEIFPILVTHMKSEPDVDAFAKEKGIRRVYYSYEFSK